MRYSHVLGAAVVGLAAATTAQAGLSVSVVPVIVADAIRGANPSIANVRSYDLVVTTDAGTKWASADLQGAITIAGTLSGSFFNESPDQTDQPLAAGPVGNSDTWLTTPERFVNSQNLTNPNSVAILGLAQAPIESGVGPAVIPTAASGDTAIDVAWGDARAGQSTLGDGSYTIARLSVQGNSGANIKGRVGATNNSIAPVSFSLYVPILGDTNMDRFVDQIDFDLWIANLDNVGNTYGTSGDIDLNGVVDQRDFDAWISNLDNTLPAAGATLGSVVPEPTSLGVIGLGLLLGARRRRA